MGHINHVSDGLYIGDHEARSSEYLQNHDIRHVISVLTPEEHQSLKLCVRPDAQIKEYRFNIGDDEKANLSSILPPILEIVNKTNENILVHCWAGISRSAAVVIGILLHKPNMLGLNSISFNGALKYLRSVRDIVDPNDGFVKDLRKLEKEISIEKLKA